jgi:HEAT repeat protein
MISTRRLLYYLLYVILLFNINCGKSPLTFSENDKIRDEITNAIHLYSSNNWEKREKAVVSMYKYKDSIFSQNILLFFLKATEDRQSAVRIKAVQGLHLMLNLSAIERLREMALQDPKANVRWHAILALGDYRIKENENIFLESFKSRDWLVREAAIKGILKIKDPDTQKKNIPLIIEAINDPVISVRLATLQSIEYKHELLYPHIAATINNKKSSLSILKAALSAIKGYRLDYKTRDKLISMLTHYDRNIRIMAFHALREEPIEY